MYIAPGHGLTTHWGQTFDVNRNPYHFAFSLQVWKKKSDFIHIFNDFIYVYSPKAKADNLLGTNFWCQQTALITLPICCRFKKICFEVRFYIHFFQVSPYVALGRGRQSIGDKILMTTDRPFLFAHMLQVSKWSLWNLILYTFFMILYLYIATGQGQKTPQGQTFDVNRKPLSLQPFVASFKRISLNFDFIHIFNVFPHIYSPGAGAENPLWTKSWCQQKSLVTLPIFCKCQKNIFEVWFYT